MHKWLGLAFGKLARRIFQRYGVQSEAERWVYGEMPRETFPPHKALDGIVYHGADDDQLTNLGTFPPVTHFYPGDHKGCRCNAVPVLESSIGPVTITVEG